MTLATLGLQICFGGTQGFYQHDSILTGTSMRVAVYVPPAAAHAPCPVVYYLSGLTCNEEVATTKAGAQRYASELGLILVMPDTSPRGAGIDGEDDDWDFGTGAGFYVDATVTPWARHYRMYSYITEELPALIAAMFPIRAGSTGIMGHSMGGHGALTIALKCPDVYRSVSAFAPICAPTQCPWGQKAFAGYLGSEQTHWLDYDATSLVSTRQITSPILIDQGSDDQFLARELMPEKFVQACTAAGQQLELRMQPGYDHSYYFIQTFIGDHLAHHAKLLV